ncbi:TetR family transcriptional regulator [Emcibacter sp. SYSU 3D8]|uniref:TetR/AcrR family transcriptional regulator n=1 Tax=Emcibacter sp. SYSU 3D8 TaxID=3133969 RepID=UPI0031FEB295
MPSPKRDHLVGTAAALFQRDGFHATGIDTILAQAGVAKMTLYNHFKSKDELIVAALELEGARYIAWLRERADSLAEEPGERLLAIFDALEEWFEQEAFNGCVFMKAASEYSAQNNQIHAAAAAQKRAVFDYMLENAQSARLKDPRNLAQQLLLLHEGAIAVAHEFGAPIAARQAKRAASVIIDDAG